MAFLIDVAHLLSLLWQHKVSIELQWGKGKIGIYCYVIADILTNIYKNVPWVVLYQAYHFCLDLLIWFVAMATKRLNLWKNIKKSSPQKP